MTLPVKLAQGVEQLGVAVSPETQQRLLQYVALLQKWNKTHNLTAVREPLQMVTRHVLDSLAVLPHLQGTRLIDVGTGAGLPGIPLALARPDLQVTLLDSTHKKTVFLQQACIELQLTNVSVVCERVEAFQPQDKFDSVISRAFSDLGEFVKLARHLCAPGGALLAMKGVYPYEELALLPADVAVEQVIPLDVPGLKEQRHLVVIRTQ